MEYQIAKHKGFTLITGIGKDILDLDKTFNCGQCFRWKQKEKGVYFGVISGIPLMIRQLQLSNKTYEIITTATQEQTSSLIANYFQLDTNYKEQLQNLDEFANKAMDFGKGIRILKQESWETLVSFIISQRNNIPKIASTIEKLCTAHGEKVTLEVEETTFTNYTFPSAEKILTVGLEGLQGLGLGYRDTYIIGAAQAVYSGTLKLDKLESNEVTGEQAINELQRLYGVGPKVANCVALFGLGKLDSFPIDIWMERVIERYYPNGININSYGKLAGLIQQYMFYYIKNN